MKPYRRPQREPVKHTPKKTVIACASCSLDEIKVFHRNTLKDSKKKGFSLIEIMVTLAIIGILGAMAMPSYMKRIENTRELATKRNTETICKAVQDVMIKHDCKEMLFSEIASIGFQEVQDLLVEGFEGAEVAGYTFHPEVLNDCYYSIVTFKGVSVKRLYTKL